MKTVLFSLRKLRWYDLTVLEKIWGRFDDVGHADEAYDDQDWRDWFISGVYMGPDANGVEPMFVRPAEAQLITYHTGRVSRWATAAEIEDAVTQCRNPVITIKNTKYQVQL